METVSYDIVVIGAGAGGLTSAIGLAKAGKNVALVEKGPMGGDCTNFGCVPSKALIHYGIHQPELGVEGALKKVRAKREHFLKEESGEQMKEKFGIDVFKGLGAFIDKKSLQVDDHTIITFKKVIIATGSHPRTIEIAGVPEDKILTNEEIFEGNKDITDLVIVGGGYIGCELGEAFARLGVNVIVVNRGNRLISNEEPEASKVIESELKKVGVTILHNSTITSGSEKELIIDVEGTPKTIPYDTILLSIGRISTTKGLGLDKAGIKYCDKGITVDKYNRTSIKTIYALGDCVEDNPKFTHWADHEARGVIRNMLVPFWKKSVREQTLPMTMYTSTEVARVGYTKNELDNLGLDNDIISITETFEHDDRSYLNDEQQGFVTIHFTRIRGKILGATIVGKKAGTMLSQITLAKDNGLSGYKLMNAIHSYPTKGRVIKKVAQSFVVETLTHAKREARYWLKTHAFKMIALVVWATAFGCFFWYKNKFGVTNADLGKQLYTFITSTFRGPIIYMVVYAIRPLILFPASILTLLSGIIFGPIWGVVYTILGENASANFAYYIGSKLGHGIIKPGSQGIFASIKKRLTENEFMSVLMMRIVPLPFDLVNYACGILQVTWKKYILATFLGIMPGLITFVLLGASVENIETFNFSEVSLNGSYLIIAAVLYALSIGLALLLKKKINTIGKE